MALRKLFSGISLRQEHSQKPFEWVVEHDDKQSWYVDEHGAQFLPKDIGRHKMHAMIQMVSSASGHSGFLAGFAYYEFSRLSPEAAKRVPWYPRMLYIAFSLALVASAVAAVVQMYSRRIRSHDFSHYCHRLNPHTYLGGCARVGYWAFTIAFMCYTIALSMMHEVFNPIEMHGNDYHLSKFFRLLGATPLRIVVVFEVLFEHYFMSIAGLALDKVKNGTLLDTNDRTDHRLILSLRTVTARAMFLVGFLGHALARWNAATSGTAHHKTLNGLYQVAASWAAASLVLSVYLGALIGMHLVDIPQKARWYYTDQVQWAIWLSQRCFKLGMFCVLITGGLMGWGCSLKCGSGMVPNGACYADVAYVPALLNGIALIIVSYFAVTSHIATNRVISEQNPYLGKAPTSEGELIDRTLEADDLSIECMHKADAEIKPLFALADLASIPGAFVMYNVATFDTDVIRAPLLCSTNFGMTVWAHLFLWANWIALSLGIAVAMSVEEMERHLSKIMNGVSRLEYLREMKARALVLPRLLQISLISFMLAFALFGMCKMEVYLIEPALVSLAALFVFAAQWCKVQASEKAATEHSRGSIDAEPDGTLFEERTNPFGVMITSESPYENAMNQMTAYSQHMLLFGGFSYNAVSFIFRSAAPLARAYSALMALCFSIAIGVTLLQILVGSSLTLLGNSRRKTEFVRLMAGWVHWAFYSSSFAITGFLAAFCIMGFIKQWTYSEPEEEHQEELSDRFGWLQFSGSIVAFASIAFLIRRMRQIKAEVVEKTRQGDLEHVDFNWSASLAAHKLRVIATTFQVGNVFYEILFGAVNEKREVITWCYFGLAVVSFVLGVIVVAVESFHSHEIYTLPTTEERAMFAFKTNNSMCVLTWLYAFSLFAWLLHFCLSASIKYPCQEMWCLAVGGGAFLIIVCTWARVTCIAGDYEQVDVQDFEVDASSPDSSPSKSPRKVSSLPSLPSALSAELTETNELSVLIDA